MNGRESRRSLARHGHARSGYCHGTPLSVDVDEASALYGQTVVIRSVPSLWAP